MPFKSDKQRKAFFAMKGVHNRQNTPQIMENNKNKTFLELKRKGITLNPKKDADKDGVPNAKDCKPFDPKRQGKLHDLAISALRKKEEFVEKRREKQMKKLEDFKDKLKARRELLSRKNDIFAEKQAIIDEFNREKENIRLVTKANKDAKKELFRTSRLGRTLKGTKEVLKGTKEVSKTTIIGTKAVAKKSAKILKKTEKVLTKLFG